MATKKMTPSQKYHAGKINRAEYEKLMARRTTKKSTKKQSKATKRVLGKKMR